MNYQKTQNPRFDESYYELLAEKAALELESRNRLSMRLLLARIALTGLEAEMMVHAAKHGKSQKWKERKDFYMSISDALDECAKMDDRIYMLETVFKHLQAQRDLYFTKWKEAEKQMEATNTMLMQS